jgi:hypothetical protein
MCSVLGFPDQRESRRYMRQRTYTRIFDAWMRDNTDWYTASPLEVTP